MNKVLAWVVLLVGIYEALALLVSSIPAFLSGTWGWIVAIVLIVLGGWMLMKK